MSLSRVGLSRNFLSINRFETIATKNVLLRALSTTTNVHKDSNARNIVGHSNNSVEDHKKVTHQNERLKKLIGKSKILTKLEANPRFSHYFKRLTTTGTIPMVTSFFILHELTAIIPLFSVWYILYNLNMMENMDFSGELLSKCSQAIERLVGDKYVQFDKHRLILSGALSYALVKVLGPIRIIVSIWGAPYFSKWLIIPFAKLGTILRRKP